MTAASVRTSTPVSGLRGWVRTRPVVAFFVLTLLLSWWPWPLYAAGWSPLPVASFGPFLAAMAVLLLGGDRDGVRALWASMRNWRIGPRGWILVLGIPVVLSSVATGLNLLFGANPTFHVSDLASVPVVFALALLVPGFGGAWEEPGWRGFAFPRLAERSGWISAALLLGVVGAAWHLPLVLSGLDSWWELGLLIGVNVVLARVFMTTGSVLSLMALHAMNNAFAGNFLTGMFDGGDADRQAALTALVWAVAAVVVLLVTRKRARA
jgi:membrane protease YdiL (CAAX protease family)